LYYSNFFIIVWKYLTSKFFPIYGKSYGIQFNIDKSIKIISHWIPISNKLAWYGRQQWPRLKISNDQFHLTTILFLPSEGEREMRHGAPSPGVENIIRRRKTAAFLLFELLSDFLARQSSGFPYFSRPSWCKKVPCVPSLFFFLAKRVHDCTRDVIAYEKMIDNFEMYNKGQANESLILQFWIISLPFHRFHSFFWSDYIHR